MDILVYTVVFEGNASVIDPVVKRLNEFTEPIGDLKAEARIPFVSLFAGCTDHLPKHKYDTLLETVQGSLEKSFPGANVSIKFQDFNWHPVEKVYPNLTDECIAVVEKLEEPSIISTNLEPFKYNLTF